MPAGDLTSVANVKAQAGPAVGSASDVVLQSLITAVSAFIGIRTDLIFTGAVAVTRYLNGGGGTELYLPEGPVQSVQSLYINNILIPAQPADGQPGWLLVDDHVISLTGYQFTKGKRNVKCTWTTGFTAVPKDIEQACIEIVVAAYKRVPRGPDITSETHHVNGSVFTISQKDLTPFADAILDGYRKVVPV